MTVEVRLPREISREAIGGDTFLTVLTVAPNGVEQRISRRSRTLGRWTISFRNRSEAFFNTVRNFFLAVRGQWVSFRFQDPVDKKSDGQQDCSPATGNGSNTVFQLQKSYAVPAGLTAYVRTITKPVSSTVKIYKQGVQQTETTHYTVNYSTGVVTFLSAPANGNTIRAEYEFDKVARFATDERESSVKYFDNQTWDQIELVEVPE